MLDQNMIRIPTPTARHTDPRYEFIEEESQKTTTDIREGGGGGPLWGRFDAGTGGRER